MDLPIDNARIRYVHYHVVSIDVIPARTFGEHNSGRVVGTNVSISVFTNIVLTLANGH